ncbi:MAG: type II toxin-antitoxin system RatA family toxin [Rhodospirillaceae bacterium]|jgi:coenzyme Q-binding protein COQ10|nr:type II toxin-antitoxin system RatA family toxin [Rhodospirillaceae bacterium]MBT4940863.1 type II toxin-antitoxin system RatA family toxin [Rhodospirillaceae bacterium]MBT5940613.1 type II toxin-antitoxin system RatA family toxin [Rhodospirillaceae bacterium]MBT7268670.1 type II toxin-antitoxin system RatA family toxin [Rhodospirillaceae bacterium]
MPTHAEQRHLPHSSQQMFDLVADVAKYPEFLPWCVGTRIREQDDAHIVADMVIGYKMFREKFTSRVELSSPVRIDVVYENGPFKYLNNHWIFITEADGTCTVDFYVDFEFKSKLLQKMIGVVFNEAVKIMVHSFEKRAAFVYAVNQ